MTHTTKKYSGSRPAEDIKRDRITDAQKLLKAQFDDGYKEILNFIETMNQCSNANSSLNPDLVRLEMHQKLTQIIDTSQMIKNLTYIDNMTSTENLDSTYTDCKS